MLFYDASMQGKNIFKEVTKYFPNRDALLFSFILKLDIISPF